MDNTTAVWIAGVAVVLSFIVAIKGYLEKRPLVPKFTLDELREENQDLRYRLERMEEELDGLKSQINQVMREREWWREEYVKLRKGMANGS